MDSADRISVADKPKRPLLIWDGECAFCRVWVERWRHQVAHAVDTVPYQEVQARFPEIPEAHFRRAVQLVDLEGHVFEGAAAVFVAFAAGGHPLALRMYTKAPLVAWVTDAVYNWVAKNRVVASKVTRALWGAIPSPSTFRVSRSLLVRGIGLVALAAFVSAWVQIDGLVGSRGIEPASTFLATVGQMATQQGIGIDRYRLVPTLFWASSTDGTLHAVLGIGCAASVLLLLDWIAPLALLVAWGSYLSVVTVGDVFFGYQWDALLLESLLAALFVARWNLPWKSVSASAKRVHPKDRTRGLMVPRVLFFKLMWLSGWVKLASHDAAWSSGHALAYHFWTQPLPTRLAWYAHRLPAVVRQGATFVTLAIELVFPFFLALPRRWRRLGFLGFASLQVVIALTGSYGFFNLLALVLSLPMLDDAAWRKAVARWPGARSWFDRTIPTVAGAKGETSATEQAPDVTGVAEPPRARTRSALVARGSLLAVTLALMITPLVSTMSPALVPGAWLSLTEYAAPLRSFNSYGLFALMTSERPEIALEGSVDGTTWEPYIFTYKPGPLGRTPRWTGLHLPRLDWQMWFAALGGDCRSQHWYVRMMRRLFENSPAVVGLFEAAPPSFHGAPPRFLRSTLSQYRFTTPEEHAASGAIWAQEDQMAFCPIVHAEAVQ